MSALSDEAQQYIRGYLAQWMFGLAALFGVGNFIAFNQALKQVQDSAETSAANAAARKVAEIEAVIQSTKNAMTGSLEQIRDLGESHGRLAAYARDLERLDEKLKAISDRVEVAIADADGRIKTVLVQRNV